MLKKLIRLNLDDLWLYTGVEGGLFLLTQIIIGGVMYFVKPADGVTMSAVTLPITAGFLTLISGISHVGVTFEQALRFGQTRRRGVGLTLGLMAFEAAFGMALGAVLAALERFVCPALWVRLAGLDGWAWAADRFPGGPKNTLFLDAFTLDWFWWLLILAASIAGGTIIGAVIQRFGQKGGWIIWGVCMGPMILGQLLPWRTHEITNWLFPLLGVLFAAGLIWSLWSMLHAVVRA